jgi:gas vesicle protein
MNDQKKSNFGLGVLIGAALGSAAAFFFSPNSGKENREMAMKKLEELKKLLKNKSLDEIVTEIFGKVSEEGKHLYTLAREEMNERLDMMKESVENIDRDKYVQLVDDVIERVKKEGDATKERMVKLQDFLMNRWGKAQDMAEDDGKKVVKANVKK